MEIKVIYWEMIEMDKKKFQVLLLTVTLSFSSLFTASNVKADTINDGIKVAPSKLSESDINAILLDQGYPQRLLNRLPLFEKRDMISGDELPEYVGAKTTFYDLNNKVISTDDYKSFSAPGGIMPMGTINSMNVTMAISKVVTGSQETYQFNNNHQWTIDPVNARTDYIGYSWDSSKFNSVPGSFQVVVGEDGLNSPATYSSVNLYDSSSAGIGFSFPLPLSFGKPLIVTKYRLKELKANQTGMMQINSKYVHTKETTGSLSFSFVIGSVGVSTTIPNDQRAEITNFYY